MSITIFGTCRVNNINNNNNLNNDINYCHSTKEIIQMIKFLKGDLQLSYPYNMCCFRTGICNKKGIEFCEDFKSKFEKSEICIIEICSSKKYVHNNHYLHHLCVDKRFGYEHIKNTPIEILNEVTVEKQTNAEIEEDILIIKELLSDKKIVVVSHYNSKVNNNYFPSRDALINTLNEITSKHNIPFINPTEKLSKFKQEEIMTRDLGHYTDFGLKQISNYINTYINIYIKTLV